MRLFAKQTSLTVREMDVLNLLASGESQQGIAKKLCISPETAKLRSKKLREKLGASTCAQAVYEAMRKQLIH